MNCLMCNRALRHTVTLKEIFSFQRLETPCVCERCINKFTKIEPDKRCLGCSRPQDASEYCADCNKWLQHYSAEEVAHTAFFHYDDNLRSWLHQYKIQGDIRFAKCFSPNLKQYYRQHASSSFVPLPISSASKAERGFNQCEVLLQEAGIPYQNLLVHQSDGKKQAEKNRAERLRSEQPFQLTMGEYDLSKPVMLFDDLYTTGRTILHAKDLLLSSGFQHVSSISVGR